MASIFYTSGTASKPKGVVCTFAELLENVEPTADAFGIGEDDRVLDFRSYNWMSAQVLSFLGPLARGATLYMARRFSQSRYFDWIREFGITVAACNPTAINMLVNRPIPVSGADLPHLRYVTSSSAALMVADWKAFEEMYGIPVAQGCGTSETGWIAGSNERTRRMGSVGRPHAYQNLTIVDEAGNPLPAGEIGAIEMGRHPDNEFRYLAEDGGYRVNSRGRARTGDLGYLDADGYLYITGRARDLIIRGGINIAPTEIDNLVLQMPGVAEAATVGVPDRIYGEEVVVYVVARPRRGARRGRRARPLRIRAAARQAAQGGDLPRVAPQDRTRQDGPQGPGRGLAREPADLRRRLRRHKMDGTTTRIRPPQTFRYEKPEAQTADKAIVSLCQTDIVRGAVQVVREGGDNNLHSHKGMDGFWMVLKGRVRWHGPDGVIGEFGVHEGIVMPRNSQYWFESVGEDTLELLQVVAFDRSVRNERVDVEPRKFDVDATERFDGRTS